MYDSNKYREPCHCPNGHVCDDINGIYIKCNVCGWIDDSTYADIVMSPGFKFNNPEDAKREYKVEEG